MAKGQTTDYASYVVKRQLEDYWRAEDKVQLVLNGMHGKIPVTTLCKLNADQIRRMPQLSRRRE